MIFDFLISNSHIKKSKINHSKINPEFSIFGETNHMGLPVNNKKAGKAGAGGPKNAAQASKFIAKPGAKAVGVTKKPIKTGGSRGS